MGNKSVTFTDIYKWYKNKAKKNKVKDIMQYNLFRLIAERMMKKALDKIIYQGKSFSLGRTVGSINVINCEKVFSLNDENKVKNAKVNWGKSNEIKRSIIARGGTPYNKKTAPDGEKWLVLYDNNRFLRFNWDKGEFGRMWHNFKPTNNNTPDKLGAKGLLVKANNANSNLIHKYKKINRRKNFVR